LHQVGTSSLLIYMMHGHTYIKFTKIMFAATVGPTDMPLIVLGHSVGVVGQ